MSVNVKTSDCDAGNIKVMYSNVDSLLNKKDELITRISDDKPDIIALSEIKPKHAALFNEEEYTLPDYDTFINKEHKRGVAIYVKKSLHAQNCEGMNISDFSESVWCTFNNADAGKVLLGCV